MSPTLTVATVPWGFPCTVSTDTYLFPRGLDVGLDDIELAATAGIETCFLCVRVGMSPASAARFAKQLAAALIFTVGDFLGLTLEECMEQLPRAAVRKLDRCLKGCPGLPEHVAPGTRWVRDVAALPPYVEHALAYSGLTIGAGVPVLPWTNQPAVSQFVASRRVSPPGQGTVLHLSHPALRLTLLAIARRLQSNALAVDAFAVVVVAACCGRSVILRLIGSRAS